MLVGTGFVGMSFAYSLLNEKGIDELVLVDCQHWQSWRRTDGPKWWLLYAQGKMKLTAGSMNWFTR